MPEDNPNLSTGEPIEADERGRESLRELFRRKKRSFIGKMVAKMVGENPAPVPPNEAANGESFDGSENPAALPPPPRDSIRDEIIESGLIAGISNRIKRSADQYLHQKLDEIEVRIDRKLMEIDRHLSDWRDKEIANRLRIVKITMWASVIVAIVSLVYSWVKVWMQQS